MTRETEKYEALRAELFRRPMPRSELIRIIHTWVRIDKLDSRGLEYLMTELFKSELRAVQPRPVSTYRSTWEGDVDRMGGSFTDREIAESLRDRW